VSIRTLEAFHALKMFQPSLGIKPYVKAMCDLHVIPFRSYYAASFTSAYDAYLMIRRRVNDLINSSLGITLEETLKTACPCCAHRVPDEPPLEYEYLISLDGNSSLKRFGDSQKEYGTKFSQRFLLTREYVDLFANEVRTRAPVEKRTRKRPNKSAAADSQEEENDDDEPQDDYQIEDPHLSQGPQIDHQRAADEEGNWTLVPGDPTDISTVTNLEDVDECVRRWKANADDSKKGKGNETID
jgi:hypothetical protein